MVEKTIELIGTSANSIEEAVALAVSRASVTLSGIRSATVVETEALVEEGRIVGWRVAVKLTFQIKDRLHE